MTTFCSKMDLGETGNFLARNTRIGEYVNTVLLQDRLTYIKQIFKKFLHASFEKSPGLSYVQGGSFTVNNGYNNLPISLNIWRTALQPGCKIIMNMVISYTPSVPGVNRCPDPMCNTRLTVNKIGIVQKWYVYFISLKRAF